MGSRGHGLQLLLAASQPGETTLARLGFAPRFLLFFFVTVGATGKQRGLEGVIYKEETQEGSDARGWQGCEGVQRAGGSEPP